MDQETLNEKAGLNKAAETAEAADAGNASGGEAGAETKAETAPLTHKANVTFDDFAKLEFRVGEVIACEEVPKSKKLLKETIQIGSETQIGRAHV